jgi:hypothetical protein
MSGLLLFYYASIANLPDMICFLLGWLLCSACYTYLSEQDVDA